MEIIKLIFKGADDNDLSVALLLDGNWSMMKIKNRPGNINPQSTHNPGVALFHNWIYIVYKGVLDYDLWMAWYDGNQWKGNVKINTMPGGIHPQSNDSPSLVVFQNRLYMIYKAWNSDTLYSAWFDGGTWYGNTPIDIDPQRGNINPKSNSTPGIAEYKGKLYMVYKGWDTNMLFFSWFDGENWYGNFSIKSQPGGIDPHSNYSPGVCVYNSNLYIVYKAWNDYVLYSSRFDGIMWRGNVPLNTTLDPRSDKNPGMVVIDEELTIFYKAWNNTTLFSSSFDRNTWKGNTPLSSQGGGIDARSNGTPHATYATRPIVDRSDWMSTLSENMLISEISLPGTHDSAAINGLTATPYATQNLSITAQLRAGIRALDVRLKVKRIDIDRFDFVTCHGVIGTSIGLNEFQSFVSLMNECKNFLISNATEVVIMFLKVDDWTDIPVGIDRNMAMRKLQYILDDYPIARQVDLPTLGSVRGRIYLFNRTEIGGNLGLGVPISWTGNTPGSLAEGGLSDRNFPVFVQDQYRGFSNIGSETEKLNLVIAAFDQYKRGQVLLNFASATWYDVTGIYINKQLLSFFGQTRLKDRPGNLGWVMFDYPSDKFYTDLHGQTSIIPLIISANVGYKGYTRLFTIIHE